MSAKKLYLPGDEWLYFRIYGGHLTVNTILIEKIIPLLMEIDESGEITMWFFIRYSDPDHHLRLRLKLNKNADTKEIINRINEEIEAYVDDDLIWKVELGSYQPEYERYGKRSMPYVERLFYCDSQSYYKILKAIPAGNEDALWLYAMLSADQLLNDFAISLERKKDLLLHLSRSFGKEFAKGKTLARELSDKYRKYRPTIEGLLDRKDQESPNDLFLNILYQRSTACQEEIDRIHDLYRTDSMEVQLDDLLSSLIHMSMNRVFLNNNRMHEMVIYDFLHRYYRSAIAKDLNKAASPQS